MLKCISEAVQAYGCILWEVTPGANLKSSPPEGRLFVLAEWFQDGSVITTHDLPLTGSVNGAVVLNQQSANIPNIHQDERVYHDRFITNASIFQTMCVVPVSFSDRENARGTLSLYRKTPVPFTEEEFARVQLMALLIPELYQAIRDKVSRELIHQVDEILHQADLLAKGEPLSKDNMKEVLHQVCVQVAETFQCIETSIFMEDRFEAADEYRLVGTTWPLSQVGKISYQARAERGDDRLGVSQ